MAKRKVDETIMVGKSPTIMQELLDTPKVKAEMAGLSPEARAWYLDLLVSEGIYDQYVKERKE